MKTKFDFYDYFIFFIILLISICIGLYFGLGLNEKLTLILDRFKLKFRKKVTPVEIELEEQSKELDENETGSKTLNYLTANHSMGAFPIALSLLATFFSSSSLLGFPAEVYQYGSKIFKHN